MSLDSIDPVYWGASEFWQVGRIVGWARQAAKYQGHAHSNLVDAAEIV